MLEHLATAEVSRDLSRRPAVMIMDDMAHAILERHRIRCSKAFYEKLKAAAIPGEKAELTCIRGMSVQVVPWLPEDPRRTQARLLVETSVPHGTFRDMEWSV
jgi:hypothetical protein